MSKCSSLDPNTLDGSAADDLEGIKSYLQKHHPHFAEPTTRMIYRRIRSLKKAPNRGRPGHRTGTRELTLAPLPCVEILHIHHGGQDWQ